MRYYRSVRTTLDLDDDLLAAAKPLARQQGVSLGQFISNLARLSLAATAPAKIRNGITLLTPKPGAPRADRELVNRLRDEE